MKKVINALVYANKKEMSPEQWLEARRQGIGGSDAAAIVGLNPYATPFSLFAEKTGRAEPPEDNEAMRQGRDFEEYVAQRFREYMAARGTPKKTKECGFMLRHPKYPWMLANVDRLIVGEKAGLECKTTSVMNLKKFRNGEYPEQYYVQCVHYMAVTGAKRWYLAVLILNQGFYTYTIERDEAEIAALIASERQFWERVEKDTPPAVDGLEPTTRALNSMFSCREGETVQLTGKGEAVARSLLALKQQIEVLNEEKTKCENLIKEEIGEATDVEGSGYRITWRPQMRNTFDRIRFEEAYPDIDLGKFYKQTQSRIFKIKEIEA